MRQWLSRSLAVLLLVPGLGLVTLDPASAATGQCRSENVPVRSTGGTAVRYERKQVCPAGVRPSRNQSVGGKGPGKSAPSCDYKSVPPATFCDGANACYYKANVVPYAPPSTPPPTPGADWRVRLCLTPFLPGRSGWQGTALWVGQANPPPPLIDQAREAFGQIVVPSATLAFNPTTRTLVNFDTWFWAQGLNGDPRRGSSAFGLVAIATPDRLQITPGDGSGTLVCPWVTVKSDRCAYAYRHSSVGGSARAQNGTPAYEASGRAIWNVRFEINGVTTTIPGAPTELTGPAMTAPVEVAEVQTIVTG